MPSSTRSPFSESQYPAIAATPPIKMAVKTMSPLAARVARAQITTPKNICCKTRTSSSVMSSNRPFSGSVGGRFSTQMLSRRINPSAHSQRNEPSSLIQASLSPGQAIAFSEHSSMSRHLAPMSLNPREHFLQRAGPLPIQPTHA